MILSYNQRLISTSMRLVLGVAVKCSRCWSTAKWQLQYRCRTSVRTLITCSVVMSWLLTIVMSLRMSESLHSSRCQWVVAWVNASSDCCCSLVITHHWLVVLSAIDSYHYQPSEPNTNLMWYHITSMLLSSSVRIERCNEHRCAMTASQMPVNGSLAELT